MEKEEIFIDTDYLCDVLADQGLPNSSEDAKELWDKLPLHIKGVAYHWGAHDTVFRDNVCVWLKENPQER